MPAFQGELAANVKEARFDTIRSATPGFPFINVATDYESVHWGLRKGAVFTADPVTNPDIQGRDILEMYDCHVKAEFKQTTFACLKNLFLQAQNNHQLLAEAQNDVYLKFTATAGTFATPTATQLVGCDWSFTIDAKERLLTMDWHTQLTDTELALLYSGSGTTSTGGTGGTALGLTDMSAYNFAAFQRAGIHTVTVNGVDIGIHQGADARFTMKSLARHHDKRGRPFNREVEIENEIVMLQSTLLDLGAGVTASQSEYTIVITDYNDCSITLTTSASTMPYPEIGDGVSRVRLVSKGTYTNSGIAMTATSITGTMKGYS